MDADERKELEAIGRKLKAAREFAGLTQAELAKQAGLSANYYAIVERGEGALSFQKMQRVLKVLKLKTLDGR